MISFRIDRTSLGRFGASGTSTLRPSAEHRGDASAVGETDWVSSPGL
jgi:hypothetical protein